MNWSLFIRTALTVIEEMPQLTSDIEALYNKIRTVHPVSPVQEAVMQSAIDTAKTQPGGA